MNTPDQALIDQMRHVYASMQNDLFDYEMALQGIDYLEDRNYVVCQKDLWNFVVSGTGSKYRLSHKAIKAKFYYRDAAEFVARRIKDGGGHQYIAIPIKQALLSQIDRCEHAMKALEASEIGPFLSA